jgi:myo-inositol-1-phosphate synthase
VVIDAVRCAKLALDRGISGALEWPSAYFMKSPPVQHPDDEAYDRVECFIRGGDAAGEGGLPAMQAPPHSPGSGGKAESETRRRAAGSSDEASLPGEPAG